MSLSRITERYAKSLLDLASDEGKITDVLNDIRGFIDLTKQRDVLNLLKSPIIKKDKKRRIFKELFDGKIDQMTMMFFNIVLNKGRESMLPEIASSFLNLYNASKNITEVELTTAVELDTQILDNIESKLSAKLKETGKVKILSKTKEDLLGGFVLKYGDNLYDASLAHKLSELRKDLIN